MTIDWQPVLSFLAYLDGELSANDLLQHPAYLNVLEHARIAYGIKLSATDLDRAVAGDDSPFFGLRDVRANAPRIRGFLASGLRDGGRWLAEVAAMLEPIAGAADLKDITVYPIVGYDAGIGLGSATCLNVNWRVYLHSPHEFPYMVAHEALHVIYGRERPFGGVPSTFNRSVWLELFARMTQDEGFAVYASLAARRANGHLGNDSHPILYDYVVLHDPELRERCLAGWLSALSQLRGAAALSRDECLDLVFGPRRLTYRAGCAFVDMLSQRHGLAQVQAAFRAPADEFASLGRELSVSR